MTVPATTVTLPLAKTGRRCTVCAHPERDAIDRALVAGGGMDRLAKSFALNRAALQRHRANHLAPAIQAAAAHTAALAVTVAETNAAEVARGRDLVAMADATHARMAGVLDKAEQSGDLRAAVQAGRALLHAVETMGKLRHEISDGVNVNVAVAMPVFASLQQTILAALIHHPTARADVLAALSVIDAPAPLLAIEAPR